MLMPETAMNENDFHSARENEIRPAGQIFAVQAVAVSHRMDETPHNQLRSGVLAPDAPHVLAAT